MISNLFRRQDRDRTSPLVAPPAPGPAPDPPRPAPAADLPGLDLRPDRPPILEVDAGELAACGSGPDPAAWARAHRHAVRAAVARHGALLVRGLGIADHAAAGAVFEALGTRLLTEREAFAVRERHAPGLYGSSAWPATQPMCMHHELSYTDAPPGTMLFACLTAPESGGATAVADSAQVLTALPAELVARFERDGWMLVRRFGDDIGAGLADAFGTDDPAAVDAYCRAHGIDTHWGSDGSLTTRQRRAAVVTHPVTGARCWFNQVAFLSEWTLEADVRDFLLDCYGPGGLPFTTCYGDGSPIGPDVVELIGATYAACTRREPWQAGDLLVVDNIASAHSREAFTGDREIVVAMTDAVSFPAPTDVTPSFATQERLP